MPARPAPTPRIRALAAQAWAEVHQGLDLQLSPLGLRAIQALSPRPGEVIADIGCGAGQTMLQLAERVGPGGQVIGVDIAPLVLDLARQRTRRLSQVRLIACDAQRLDLPDQSLDGVFSRFGVMAFADPVAAFANFHRIMKPSGRLAFVCWRSLRENELDRLPLRAAGLEAMLDPTPFSFEDPDRLRAILLQAGFRQIGITAYDEPVSSGDLDAMATVLLKVGPLGKILRENPELRDAAEPRLRAALGIKGHVGQPARQPAGEPADQRNGSSRAPSAQQTHSFPDEPPAVPSRVTLWAATWIVTARPVL